MLKKLKQYFCKHKWNVSYIYGMSALYHCSRCGKHKNDWANLK